MHQAVLYGLTHWVQIQETWCSSHTDGLDHSLSDIKELVVEGGNMMTISDIRDYTSGVAKTQIRGPFKQAINCAHTVEYAARNPSDCLRTLSASCLLLSPARSDTRRLHSFQKLQHTASAAETGKGHREQRLWRLPSRCWIALEHKISPERITEKHTCRNTPCEHGHCRWHCASLADLRRLSPNSTR